MITKIRHNTGVVVRDLIKSLKFYESLGSKLASRQIEQGDFIDQVAGLEKVKVETAKLLSPCGGMLELLLSITFILFEDYSMQRSNNLGCSHIVLSVSSLTRTLKVISSSRG